MMYNDYFNNSEHSEDQLFDEIVQLNSKESLKSFDDFFPRIRADKWKNENTRKRENINTVKRRDKWNDSDWGEWENGKAKFYRFSDF